MPLVQSRPMVATDFEDIALFDHKDVKGWQHRLDYHGQRKTPQNIIIPTSDDLHASVQSVASTISTSTTSTSDSSSLRSSLSSISSPALVTNQFLSNPDQAPAKNEVPIQGNRKASAPTSLTPLTGFHKSLGDPRAIAGPKVPNGNIQSVPAAPFGRRRSVPALLDNTSMASLTIKATNGSRTRKQRELEYEADQDDDIWTGDSLMFNVPMSPALYAQQKLKQYHMNDTRQGGLHSQSRIRSRTQLGQDLPGNRPQVPVNPNAAALDGGRNQLRSEVPPFAKTAAIPPQNQQHVPAARRRSSGYQKHKPLPSIHENHSALANGADGSAIESGQDFHSPQDSLPTSANQPSFDGPVQGPYYRSSESSFMDKSVSSLPSLLSRRGSCAESTIASIDGLNPDASDITLALCKLDELQQSRCKSGRSSQQRNSRDSDLCDSTILSISSLAMSDSDGPLPSPTPALRNSLDSANDSRRSSLTRPDNLPPKTPQEERKHLKEYEQLLKDAAAAEKKKQQKKEEQEKQRLHQLKQDNATWENWLAKGCNTRLSSDLKWRGVPERLRGAIWFSRMGGNIQTLNETPAVNTAYFQQITNDAEKVWPECAIFGAGRPLHDSLIFVVQRFLGIHPEVKYSPSLTYLAALILLYLDTPQAVSVLLNVLKPGSLAFSILSGNERLTSANYVSFQKIFQSKFERLSAHLAKKDVTYTELLNPMLSSIFTTVMPTPELSARILDVFIFDGDSFLLRTALGLLRMNEAWLYASKEEILSQMQNPRVESEDETMKMIREVTRN